MSQGIQGIMHFQKCLGNGGIPGIVQAFVGIPGISWKAKAIGGIYDFFTNLQFWETARQQKLIFKN